MHSIFDQLQWVEKQTVARTRRLEGKKQILNLDQEMTHYLEGTGFITVLVYICMYFIAVILAVGLEVVRTDRAEDKSK